MNKYICAAAGGNSIIVYVILIVALIAMLVMPYFTQKKRNKEFLNMIESMKVGDLVKTAGGIIGKITKITDKGDIKTVILETGSKSEKSYMEFDMSMIYCVLKSTKAAETKPEESNNNENAELKADEKVENTAEVVVEKEVKPQQEKKSVAKKNTTTAKKATTKKKAE